MDHISSIHWHTLFYFGAGDVRRRTKFIFIRSCIRAARNIRLQASGYCLKFAVILDFALYRLLQ